MKEDENSDFEIIRETIQQYVDGVKEFDFSKAEKAWHPEGIKISLEEKTNKFKTVTLSHSRPVNPPPPTLKQQGIIESIDRTGAAAIVRLKWHVESPEWGGTVTDYISLLKNAGSWVIVAKVFHESFETK